MDSSATQSPQSLPRLRLGEKFDYDVRDKRHFNSAKDLFCASPRLSLAQVFYEAAAYLHPDTIVDFLRHKEGNVIWIAPVPEQRDPQLIYTHYPEFQSVRVNGIYAGEQRNTGIGSAFLLSQLPFWQKLGVKHVSAATFSSAVGFFRRMGFQDVLRSPEHEGYISKPPHTLLVRLNFDDAAQNAQFRGNLEACLRKQERLPRKDRLLSPDIAGAIAP